MTTNKWVEFLNKIKPQPKWNYTFLCRSCDIFFENHDGRKECPLCKKPAQTWKVDKFQQKED